MKKNVVIGGILVAVVIGCMTIGGVVVCSMSYKPNEVVYTVVHTATKEIALEEHKVTSQNKETATKEEKDLWGKVYHFFEKANPVAQFFACIAGVLGIVYPITAWMLEKRPPFKIKSITALKNNTNGNVSYVIVFKNLKRHFVTIKQVSVYANRFYMISRGTGNSATLTGPTFIIDDRIVFSKMNLEFCPHSSCRTIISGGKDVKTNRLFVRLNTTSGDQTIKYKKISYEDIGKLEIYNDIYDINNFIKAQLVYYGIRIPQKQIRQFAAKQGEKWKVNRD